ncbi:hypothetical protein SNEBB_002947 [Seison nebaliae]|nr:hypothetical protein SNEBB_002947 [Seison nebaliae]
MRLIYSITILLQLFHFIICTTRKIPTNDDLRLSTELKTIVVKENENLWMPGIRGNWFISRGITPVQEVSDFTRSYTKEAKIQKLIDSIYLNNTHLVILRIRSDIHSKIILINNFVQVAYRFHIVSEFTCEVDQREGLQLTCGVQYGMRYRRNEHWSSQQLTPKIRMTINRNEISGTARNCSVHIVKDEFKQKCLKTIPIENEEVQLACLFDYPNDFIFAASNKGCETGIHPKYMGIHPITATREYEDFNIYNTSFAISCLLPAILFATMASLLFAFFYCYARRDGSYMGTTKIIYRPVPVSDELREHKHLQNVGSKDGNIELIPMAHMPECPLYREDQNTIAFLQVKPVKETPTDFPTPDRTTDNIKGNATLRCEPIPESEMIPPVDAPMPPKLVDEEMIKDCIVDTCNKLGEDKTGYKRRNSPEIPVIHESNENGVQQKKSSLKSQKTKSPKITHGSLKQKQMNEHVNMNANTNGNKNLNSLVTVAATNAALFHVLSDQRQTIIDKYQPNANYSEPHIPPPIFDSQRENSSIINQRHASRLLSSQKNSTKTPKQGTTSNSRRDTINYRSLSKSQSK